VAAWRGLQEIGSGAVARGGSPRLVGVWYNTSTGTTQGTSAKCATNMRPASGVVRSWMDRRRRCPSVVRPRGAQLASVAGPAAVRRRAFARQIACSLSCPQPQKRIWCTVVAREQRLYRGRYCDVLLLCSENDPDTLCWVIVVACCDQCSMS
jgi:hypothetical protein